MTRRSYLPLALAVGLLPVAFAGPKLRVGYGRVHPITYRNAEGKAAGFAVDVLTEAARREGITLEWVTTSNPATAEAMLAQGNIDLLSAGMVTPERQTRFYVSRPWWSHDLTLLTRANFTGPIRRMSMSQIHAALAKKSYPNAVVVSERYVEEDVAAVCTGKVDAALITHGELHAVFMDRPPACRAVALNSGDTNIVVELALISRRADERPVERLRKRIDEMAIDGSLIRFAGMHPPIPTAGAVRLAAEVRERSRARAWMIIIFLIAPFAIWAAVVRRPGRIASGRDDLTPDVMPGRPRRLLFAVVITLVAVGGRYLLAPILGYGAPFLLQSFAIAAAAQYGGMLSGLAATAVAVLLSGFVYPEVALGFFPLRPGDATALGLFTLLGVSLSYLGERFIAAKRRQLEAEREKALELRHKAELESVYDSLRLAIEGSSGAEWEIGIDPSQPGGLADSMIMNPRLKSFIGFGKHEFPNSVAAWRERIHPDDLPAVVESAQAHQEGRTPSHQVEYRIRHKDGSWRWILTNGCICRNSAGDPLRWAGVDWDITERKRSEEALRRSEAKMRAVFRALAEGIVFFNPRGEVEDANDPAARIYGQSPQQLSDPPFDPQVRIVRPDGTSFPFDDQPAIVALRTGQAVRDVEMGVSMADGTISWKLVNAQPVRDDDGTLLGAVASFFDITERKRAEEALRQAQKLESVGLLAGGVAHDFNNLLTVIMGSASSALEERPGCEYSKAVVAAAERAAHLTKQLLVYAGKGQFVKKPLDVSDLVERSKQLLSASVPKRVELKFDLANGLPSVEEDPSRVEQIVMNLVINAGEAIPPMTDGRIGVTTGACEITPDAARRQARYDVAAGPYVWLEVKDNGAGMEDSVTARIFDPFFSTKFTGRGLGLAAVDGIVRSSKGFIDVRSFPGGGTTFRVFLPASAAKRPADAAPSIKPRPARGSAMVLVVDDEDMVRKMAAMILRHHGYDVLEATDGKHALELLAEAPVLPSVVLLDVAMPVMGGDELVPVLVEKYPELKIVISSGYADEEARVGFPATSVAGFLQKPYTAAALTQTIESILKTGRQDRRVVELPLRA